ncbi:MAG: hypothetical protein WDW36_002726 [Sanguina aurantia]
MHKPHRPVVKANTSFVSPLFPPEPQPAETSPPWNPPPQTPTSSCWSNTGTSVCETGLGCLLDGFDPYYASCRPCAQVCANCTSSSGPRASTLSCKQCLCPAATSCSATVPCQLGSFCSASSKRCLSCYECINDSNALSGSCAAECLIPARSAFPAYGLPAYVPTAPAATNYIVDDLYVARALFVANSGHPFLNSTADLAHLMPSAGLAHLSSNKLLLTYLWAQLNMANKSKVLPEDFVRVFSTSADPYHVFCPPDHVIFAAAMSFPGCTCTAIPQSYQENYDTSVISILQRSWLDSLGGTLGSGAVAGCPTGYRCSTHAFESMRHVLQRQYIQPSMGICAPCLIGEYCPSGTFELSTTLSNVCTGQTAVVVAGAADTNSSGSTSCDNIYRCPAGSFCPTPDVLTNCTAGNFCGLGTINPLTCNLTSIFVLSPFAKIQNPPDLVINKVLGSGAPISGNFCPVGSDAPYTNCQEGYFCPNSSAQIICPSGYFCPPLLCPTKELPGLR